MIDNLPEISSDEKEQFFLNVLVEHARTYGWQGDYEEVWRFVDWCHRVANKPVPTDIEPYETDADPFGFEIKQ